MSYIIHSPQKESTRIIEFVLLFSPLVLSFLFKLYLPTIIVYLNEHHNIDLYNIHP